MPKEDGQAASAPDSTRKFGTGFCNAKVQGVIEGGGKNLISADSCRNIVGLQGHLDIGEPDIFKQLHAPFG